MQHPISRLRKQGSSRRGVDISAEREPSRRRCSRLAVLYCRCYDHLKLLAQTCTFTAQRVRTFTAVKLTVGASAGLGADGHRNPGAGRVPTKPNAPPLYAAARARRSTLLPSAVRRVKLSLSPPTHTLTTPTCSPLRGWVRCGAAAAHEKRVCPHRKRCAALELQYQPHVMA